MSKRGTVHRDVHPQLPEPGSLQAQPVRLNRRNKEQGRCPARLFSGAHSSQRQHVSGPGPRRAVAQEREGVQLLLDKGVGLGYLETGTP